MPVTINDVLSTPDGGLEFHFTVSDERHHDALIATLSLDEALAIANSKNSGDLFAMCCAIKETSEHKSLIGRTFGDTA